MNELINKIFNVFMFPFEKLALNKRRLELIPKAKGNILEIGSGGGVNFNYYKKEHIDNLTVMDLKFNKAIKNHKLNDEIKINYLIGNAEEIPFEDNTFDSVVATLVFCAIENQEKALKEVYRILKPDGKLYFIEHVIPNENHYVKIANSCNNIWHKIGKCNINRATHKNIENANFEIREFERFGKECFIFVKGIGIKKLNNS